jgi:hypothetical protein
MRVGKERKTWFGENAAQMVKTPGCIALKRVMISFSENPIHILTPYITAASVQWK